MQIFQSGDYHIISELIEQKLPKLRENADFNEKYLRLTENIEKLEKCLSEEQLQIFHDIIQLFYETEEYYFAFSYSLGIKYGQEIEKL